MPMKGNILQKAFQSLNSNPLSMNTLHYYTRSVCGNFNAYLVDCPQAYAIRALTGRKILFGSDTRALEALGFEFVQVVDPEAVMPRV
jgi:hypothetical protein